VQYIFEQLSVFPVFLRSLEIQAIDGSAPKDQGKPSTAGVEGSQDLLCSQRPHNV
jgi:hypothetical protein